MYALNYYFFSPPLSFNKNTHTEQSWRLQNADIGISSQLNELKYGGSTVDPAPERVSAALSIPNAFKYSKCI